MGGERRDYRLTLLENLGCDILLDMNENRILIPVAVLVAIVIIIGAVLLSNRRSEVEADPIGDITAEELAREFSVRAVSEEDHILGNPDADIILVEYSDYQCPFCAQHHPTVEKLMSEYGKDGKLAWVYRHYPLSSHDRAQISAEAAECTTSLSDDPAAFWKFSAEVFKNQPASLTDSALEKIAEDLGVDAEEYNKCLDEGRFTQDVQDDKEDGDLIQEVDPGFGTPYNILIRKDGLQVPLSGAQPYEIFKQVIDLMLEDPTSQES